MLSYCISISWQKTEKFHWMHVALFILHQIGSAQKRLSCIWPWWIGCSGEKRNSRHREGQRRSRKRNRNFLFWAPFHLLCLQKKWFFPFSLSGRPTAEFGIFWDAAFGLLQFLPSYFSLLYVHGSLFLFLSYFSLPNFFSLIFCLSTLIIFFSLFFTSLFFFSLLQPFYLFFIFLSYFSLGSYIKSCT